MLTDPIKNYFGIEGYADAKLQLDELLSDCFDPKMPMGKVGGMLNWTTTVYVTELFDAQWIRKSLRTLFVNAAQSKELHNLHATYDIKGKTVRFQEEFE